MIENLASAIRLAVYLDNIVNSAHRDYAIAIAERIIAEEPGRSYIPTPPTGCSWLVGEHLMRDLNYALRYGGTGSTWYERHLAKQEWAKTKRAITMRRRKEYPDRVEPRDSQRKKLYDAEMTIRPMGRTFETVQEMQSYVDKLIRSAWYKRRWTRKRMTVRPGHGHRRATAEYATGTIQMPKWARCEAVLLHEIAHILAYNRHRRLAAHGREFAATYLELVHHQMGRGAWLLLKASFVLRKVRHTMPRPKRPMDPAQRAAAIERLAAARNPSK